MMKPFSLTLFIVLAQATLTHASISTPMNQLMMAHYDEKAIEKRVPKTQSTESHYRMVLFFSNQCPHCVSFAPVLKRYAQVNQWHIEAISLNGETLPEFPNATFATQDLIDVAYRGKPVVYPALFIANTLNKTVYPVSFGEMSYPELEERMQQMLVKMKDYEEKR